MKVTIKSLCLVKPAQPTWSGCLPLTEFDFTADLWHVPNIYLYRPSKDWLTPDDTIIKTLKRSLGEVLVHFYPLAGRLRSITGGGGRLELDCNAAGVQLTEAEADAKLDDHDREFKTFFSTKFDQYLRPPIHYINMNSLEEIPLLLVQVTRFLCGAVGVAMSISHAVVDGMSIFHFYSEWARLSRGEPLDSPPFHDRKLMLRAGDPAPHARPLVYDPPEEFTNLPTLIGELDHENQRSKEVKINFFKLTKSQVEKLKHKANQSSKCLMNREYSRYEVVTAHIWRSTCKARNHRPEQPTNLFIMINSRRRLNPPLPETYFGNAVVYAKASGRSGEIVSKPLEFTLRKVRETIERCADPDYINSVIDFLKQEQDLTHFQDLEVGVNVNKLGSYYGNPNIAVNSWLTLPIYDMDFGWGKEYRMGPKHRNSDGEFLLLPGQNGDGSVDVMVPLQVDHMDAFDTFFHQLDTN